MKICLDAGHYGKYNQSPAVRSYYESKAMWELHLLLKAELEKLGFEVVLTRIDQEVDKGLAARGRISEGCDLFISLHSNAVGNNVREDVDYVTAYAGVNGAADEIARILTSTVAQTMLTKQEPRIEHKYNSTNTGDYYGVLYGATEVGTPALILEHSFHTNTQMTNWLLDKNNLQKLAEAEALAIKNYYKKEETEVRYKRLSDIPNDNGFRDIIEDLMNHGYIKGDGSDKYGNNDIIDLSHDMVRILVFLYRGGCFKL